MGSCVELDVCERLGLPVSDALLVLVALCVRLVDSEHDSDCDAVTDCVGLPLWLGDNAELSD